MKYCYFIFVISLLGSVKSYSQNLVPNHSFEDYNYCPERLFYFQEYTTFDNTFNNWKVPFYHGGTPDYFNECIGSSRSSTVPDNLAGHQYAQHGKGYIGILAMKYAGNKSSNIREYVMAKLTKKLVANEKYTLSMFVSLSESSQAACNGIGMVLLSQNHINQYTPLAHTQRLQNYKFINMPIASTLVAQQVIQDKTNWVELKTEYTAKGDEEYLAIGNFYSDASTTVISQHQSTREAYYYIDNILVMTTKDYEDYLLSNTEIEKKYFSVYPNPATDVINIESENEVFKSVEIYDVNGRLIPLNTINKEAIDVSSLSSGSYFLKIKSDKGEETHKIIKK